MSKLSKVEFLQTSAGVYGVAHIGDKLVLNSRLAKELEEKGTVKVTGDASDSAEESIPEKGSIRFTQVDDTEKKVVTAPKEKSAKAGPNAPKKK